MDAASAIMRKVMDAFAEADLRPLFDHIAENIQWKSASAADGPFMFGGTYEKPLGVLQVTSQISYAYKLNNFSAKEIVASGDIVWGLIDVEGEYLPTPRSTQGRPFRFEMAI